MKTIILAIWTALFAVAASAQTDYLVRPGDVLTVEVLEDSELNRDVLVLPDGQFSFPFARTVRAGGRTLHQISEQLTSALAPNFAIEPNVFVSIGVLSGTAPAAAPTASASGPSLITIFVIGEVNSPGPTDLPHGTTLMQAFAYNGGFTPFAATKRVQLRRNLASGEQDVIELNFQAISDGAGLINDVVLRDGDIILVPERRLFE